MADKKKTATSRTRRAAARAASNADAASTRVPGRAGRRAEDPNAQPASVDDVRAVRAGKAKADNTKPAPRPRALGPLATDIAPARVTRTVERDTADTHLATVVPITERTRKLKGFREVEVVATRLGHYDLKRRKAGEVFTIGLVGDGNLPSWVKLATKEDKDPKVARSRQVSLASSAEEIQEDAAENAGTDVPLALGGNQRRPTTSSGDVL